MNTRDPRDPKDPRAPRETGVYRAAEPRSNLKWLYWAIPLALVLLALPFIFRGQREPVQTRTAAVEQRQLPCAAVNLNSGSSTLTDADQQNLAQCVSSARQNGSSIAVTGSREGTDAVRQALVSQGMPDANIRVSEATTGDPGRVVVFLR
jgi:outer membrane protein OmpA-like peptidoglycan-associated protein